MMLVVEHHSFVVGPDMMLAVEHRNWHTLMVAGPPKKMVQEQCHYCNYLTLASEKHLQILFLGY